MFVRGIWVSQYKSSMKVTIIAELIPSNNKEIEYVITDGSPNKNVLDNDPIYFLHLLQNYMQLRRLCSR
jgi:hypothetical protein